MKSEILLNMSKSQRLTSTFFTIIMYFVTIFHGDVHTDIIMDAWTYRLTLSWIKHSFIWGFVDKLTDIILNAWTYRLTKSWIEHNYCHTVAWQCIDILTDIIMVARICGLPVYWIENRHLWPQVCCHIEAASVSVLMMMMIIMVMRLLNCF